MQSGAMLGDPKTIVFGRDDRRVQGDRVHRDALGFRLVADERYALVFSAGGTMLRIQKV